MSKHRLLVIGVGSIGERHLRCFQTTGRAELCLCEPGEELRKSVADRYGVSKAYASLDEALSDTPRAFDAAVIGAPSHLHIPMARQLAEQGIHLFIEKPLSTSLEGIDELMRTIEEKRLTAAVAYTYRSHPALRSMRQAIAEGRFGKPVQLVSVWGQHFPKYRPAYRQIYYTKRETGGGAIQDVLTHAVNAGEFLVGPVERVMADAAHQVLEGVDVEDTVHVICRQGGNVMSCYSLNQHQAPNESSITVICEKGTARFELHNARWLSMVEPGTEWKVEFQFSMERDDIFVHQAGLFMDALEGKSPPACSVADGLQTLRVNMALLSAAFNPNWRPVRK